MKKKTKIILGVVAGVVVLVAVANGGKDGGKTADAGKSAGTSATAARTTAGDAGSGAPKAAATTAAASAATSAAPKAQDGMAPVTLTGHGQTLSGKFTAADGLTVLHATCKACSESFDVDIIDDKGKTADMSVAAFGSYDGFHGAGLDKGTYQLKVDADADWTVVVTQPRGATAAKLPQTYQGEGDQIVGPIDADGAFQINATNAKDDFFSITVLGPDGDSQDLPVMETSKYSGLTMAQPFDSGPYYLDIKAGGSWTVKVSPR